MFSDVFDNLSLVIDPRINEVWLNKILMDQGKSIREFVSKSLFYPDF
jgi:hypothetical protein